jgi:hypothetical protein
MHTHSHVAPDVSREAAGARSCRMTDGGRGSLTRYVRSSGSAFCLAAFRPAGRPPGYGGDRRVGLVQRFRCPGRRITAPGGQRQAMHERPGQRQGDSQQQPHPQAPGEKCPHAQGPFVVPREVPRRYPPCPGLTTKPSGHSGNRETCPHRNPGQFRTRRQDSRVSRSWLTPSPISATRSAAPRHHPASTTVTSSRVV